MSSYLDASSMNGYGLRHHHRLLHRGGALYHDASGAGKRHRRHHHGRGFFGDLWDGVKSVGRAALPFANDMLKKTGIVGNLAGMIPGVGGLASTLAKSAGYGRKRRRVGGFAMRRPIGWGRKRRVHKGGLFLDGPIGAIHRHLAFEKQINEMRKRAGLGRRRHRRKVGGVRSHTAKVHKLLRAIKGIGRRHRRR